MCLRVWPLCASLLLLPPLTHLKHDSTGPCFSKLQLVPTYCTSTSLCPMWDTMPQAKNTVRMVAEVSIILDDTLLCCPPKNHTMGASVNLSIKAQQTPTHHLHFLSMVYEDTAAHGQERPKTRPKRPLKDNSSRTSQLAQQAFAPLPTRLTA